MRIRTARLAHDAPRCFRKKGTIVGEMQVAIATLKPSCEATARPRSRTRRAPSTSSRGTRCRRCVPARSREGVR